MNSSGSASPSTWGPITIPSISSTTTTGGASRRGTATTVTAASAAVRMIAKKEVSSTVIKCDRLSVGLRTPSSSLSFSITSTGSGSTPLRAARWSETRSPSSTDQSRRWTRVSPSVSTWTTAAAAGSISFAVSSARWRWRGCWSESSRKIAENLAPAPAPSALPADDLVVVELGELVLEGVLLGVLVDLALPAVGDRDGQLAAVDQRHGAGDLLGDLGGARRSARRGAPRGGRRRRRSRSASRRPTPTSAAISQATVKP